VGRCHNLPEAWFVFAGSHAVGDAESGVAIFIINILSGLGYKTAIELESRC
jgi:hypothetical protein